jgi:uroporphyrinogen-III synthase
VRRADVYRRSALPVTLARRRALAELPRRSALLVSSAEALSALWRALDDDQRRGLRRRVAVASSERLRERLRALGFTRVLRADGASPAALLDALAADVRARA